MQPSPKPILNALTGLRFVAAVHVVLYHFGQSALATAPDWAQHLLAGGDASVSLFFVLSGFVLTYTYAGSRTLRLREFLAARFARLYPMYLLSLLLAAPFMIAGLLKEFSLGTAAIKAVTSIVPVLTLTQAWVWQMATKWNFPAWSLSAEAFFYLLFPILLPRVGTLQGRTLITATGALWATAIAAPLAFIVFDLDHLATQPQLTDGPWLSTIAYTPILHLPEFLTGMFTARAFQRRVAPLAGRTAALLSVAAVLAIMLIESSSRIPDPLLHNGLLTPIFALLVYALASGRGPVAGLLSLPTVMLLGEASYSIYILQYPVWAWTKLAAERLGLLAAADGFPLLTAYMFILVGVSIATSRWVEQPARVSLRRLLGGRQSHPPYGRTAASEGAIS